MVISQFGKIIRCDTKTIRAAGRATQGVRILNLEPEDKVAAAVIIPPEELKDDEHDAAAVGRHVGSWTRHSAELPILNEQQAESYRYWQSQSIGARLIAISELSRGRLRICSRLQRSAGP